MNESNHPLSKREYLALNGPPVPEWLMKVRTQQNKNLNPFNEPHKPPILDQAEIELRCRFEWADKFIQIGKETENKK